jgi:hypothetical protein
MSIKSFIVVALVLASMTLQGDLTDADIAACQAVSTVSSATCSALSNDNMRCCAVTNITLTADSPWGHYCTPIKQKNADEDRLRTQVVGFYATKGQVAVISCSSSFISFSAVLAVLAALLF